MCLQHYIQLIWESPTTEDKNLHRHLRSLHSKLETNGLYVDRNHKISEGIFSTPVIFRATSKLFSSQDCSDDKNWVDFSSIFFKICRFRSSILLSLQVLFSEERRSRQVWHAVARFFSTNRNSLLRIATNEIASFWKDQRSRHDQMAFFHAKAGQRRGKRPAFALCWNVLKYFRYYIKQIDSMLPCVWSVIDHRWRQNLVRAKKWHTRR